MTQLISAREGKITDEVARAAAAEEVSPDELRRRIAAGVAVLPYNNQLPPTVRAVAIGSGLRTKVNANVGTSRDRADLEAELCKVRVSEEAGADAIMDLSTGGDLAAIRAAILKETSLPLGTVPIYEVAAGAEARGIPFDAVTADDMFAAVEGHARQGVSFVTIHVGVTSAVIERLLSQGREMDIVSRGGALMAGWILATGRENPFYEHYDRLLDISRRYDVTLSLGDGLRPGCLADAGDRAQISELIVLAELAQRARDAGVQVMLEGPGHMRLDQIADHIRLQKQLSHHTPFYTLGPLVTDVAAGFDHISAAIGGAIAAAAGVDFLCYVTPAEHLGLPTLEDVRAGVIAARIAAHAGDLVKGITAAAEWDLKMSRARRSFNWEEQARLAIYPPEAARRRQSDMPRVETETCTMCANLCAMKLSQKALGR